MQAVSRDLLCYAMHNLSDHQICGHVHDELIIECPEDTEVSSITAIMGQSPAWMPDILIIGDGYETRFYMVHRRKWEYPKVCVNLQTDVR